MNEIEYFLRFSYEYPSTRALAMTGEKTTKGQVKSMNAVTHSYTIMPIISLAGKLIGPLFICLQEPTGKLGPRVKQSLYQANNIHVTCSKSGKLTKHTSSIGLKIFYVHRFPKIVYYYLTHGLAKLIPAFMITFLIKISPVNKCKFHQKQLVIFSHWIVIFSDSGNISSKKFMIEWQLMR